jgi:hypothetical protein
MQTVPAWCGSRVNGLCVASQADICQLGMDQRKVNMLAREYCDECKPKKKFKPIILSHRAWYSVANCAAIHEVRLYYLSLQR